MQPRRSDTEAPAAILSPHFDDAVLSCWHLLESQRPVDVINVFTASPPAGSPAPWWDTLTGATDPVARMAERREEDRDALGLMGHRGRALGLLDDQYRDETPSTESVLGTLERALTPGSTIYAPAAIGGHKDHVLVRDAAAALSRRGWPLVIYADIPHATKRGWPTWVTGDDSVEGREIGEQWTRVLAEAGLIVDRLVPRVHPLDARARGRKLHAVAMYKTQLPALASASFVPFEDPRALAWEVLWEVPRSALRGEAQPGGQPVVADTGGDLFDDRP